MMSAKAHYALDPHLLEGVERACKEYFVYGKQSCSVSLDSDEIQLDGKPEFITEMLFHGSGHDDDYIVFKHLSHPNSAILDIGANWGYSVGSIWSLGYSHTIISFEVIPFYAACLQKIKDLFPHRYEYFSIGLYDRHDVCKFAAPIVNGVVISSLMTASAHPDLNSLARNIIHHVQTWMPDMKYFSIQFAELTLPTRTLDDMILENGSVFCNRNISAIKIDVEGLEYNVLKGSMNTLREYQPLLLVETGMRNNNLIELITSMGYTPAKRLDDHLILEEPLSGGPNTFFVHRDKIEDYKRCGIINK